MKLFHFELIINVKSHKMIKINDKDGIFHKLFLMIIYDLSCIS